MIRRTRLTTMLSAALGLVFSSAAGGSPPRAAGFPPGQEVLGTVEARVDGVLHTWHIVLGSSGGRPYASGGWMELGDGSRALTLGGFDRPDPPLATFEWTEDGVPSSYGDYDGSVLGLLIRVPEEGSSFTVSLPDAGGLTGVTYQRRASLENLVETSYLMAEGTIDVTSVSVTSDGASVEGTFSGTLRPVVGEGEPLALTDGTFRGRGLPNLRALQP